MRDRCLTEHFLEYSGKSIAEHTHYRRCETKSEEYCGNALFERYTSQNSDERACPSTGAGEGDTYEEKKENKLSLFHFFTLVESFFLEEVYEFAEQWDIVLLYKIKDFINE